MTEFKQITTTSSVREGYDRWAPIYDHDANPMTALEGPLVRAAVGEAAGLRVLDLGCGTGRHSLWLAAGGAHVTGVDLSEGMLAEARIKPGAAAIRFLAHDLSQPVPFASGSFDLVVSGLVLEHLAELTTTFAEAARVLVPGGRSVISAMHPAMFLRGTQARFVDPETGVKIQPGSHPHSISDFVMAAVRAGLLIDDLTEHAPDERFALAHPRTREYVDWPMVVVMRLRRPG
ncbi:MAG: class I SAM-dependent methyltransferase [Chloroflexota bacterium]